MTSFFFKYQFFSIGLFLFICFSSSGQSGPGGIGSTDGKSSLKIWLDAVNYTFSDSVNNTTGKGVRITTLNDRSGSNANALLPDTAAQVYSLQQGNEIIPYVRFYPDAQGRSQGFLIIDSTTISTQSVIYTVIKPSKKTRKEETIFSFYTENLIDNNEGSLRLSLKDSVLKYSMSGSNKKNSTEITSVIRRDSVTLVKCTISSVNKTLTLSVNGGTPLSTSIPGNFNLPKTGRIFLGNDRYGETMFHGGVASFISYTSALHPVEQILLENALSAKYNTPLISNNFYTYDGQVEGNFDIDVAGIGKSSDGYTMNISKGEGMLQFQNPRNLDLNEYMFWGRNALRMQQTDSTDVPRNSPFRLATSWRVSETGSIGGVDVIMDTSSWRLPAGHTPYLIIDKNGNGQFTDEQPLIFGFNPATKFLYLSNIDFSNGDLFTLGAYLDLGQLTNTMITPNGDGVDDTYYVQRRGMVRIIDQNGFLVRELRAPTYWDGRNNAGTLSPPGNYILEVNEQERISISVRY